MINYKNEIWKDIENFKGFYQVSNLGRIKALKRDCKIGENEYIRDERILKPYLNKKRGYLQVTLTRMPIRKLYTVHRLVATYFISNPNNYNIVNHIDGNKLNNNYKNLEWCTQSHNIKEAYKNNLIPKKRKRRTGIKYKKHRFY